MFHQVEHKDTGEHKMMIQVKEEGGSVPLAALIAAANIFEAYDMRKF